MAKADFVFRNFAILVGRTPMRNNIGLRSTESFARHFADRYWERTVVRKLSVPMLEAYQARAFGMPLCVVEARDIQSSVAKQPGRLYHDSQIFLDPNCYKDEKAYEADLFFLKRWAKGSTCRIAEDMDHFHTKRSSHPKRQALVESWLEQWDSEFHIKPFSDIMPA